MALNSPLSINSLKMISGSTKNLYKAAKEISVIKIDEEPNSKKSKKRAFKSQRFRSDYLDEE